MASEHHGALIRSSMFADLFDRRTVRENFAEAIDDPAEREQWIDVARQWRLVPDAHFVVRAGSPEYAEQRRHLQTIAHHIAGFSDTVSMVVAVEADVTSVLGDSKLKRYAQWWAYFECLLETELVLICIDRYGRHHAVSAALLDSMAYARTADA